jgi:hypothetical protein
MEEKITRRFRVALDVPWYIEATTAEEARTLLLAGLGAEIKALGPDIVEDVNHVGCI